ncbi:sporulation protein YunB [Bacillaceae bacterium W0354]
MRRLPKNRFKKRKPKTFSEIIMITLVCFVIAIILSVWIINEGIEPTLIDIAETKTAQFAREAINEAVSKRIVEDLEFDDLVQLEQDEEGNLVSVGWNAVVVNRVLRNSTFRVQNYLKRLERGEVQLGETLDFDLDEDEEVINEDEVVENEAIVRIPIGQATGNTLLANLGPRVPVHFTVIGDVQSDFITEMEEYGINSALVKLSIEIQANVQIVIPFATSTKEVVTSIPIDIRTISGKVPEFYSSGGKSPSLSIPYSQFVDEEEDK